MDLLHQWPSSQPQLLSQSLIKCEPLEHPHSIKMECMSPSMSMSSCASPASSMCLPGYGSSAETHILTSDYGSEGAQSDGMSLFLFSLSHSGEESLFAILLFPFSVKCSATQQV